MGKAYQPKKQQQALKKGNAKKAAQTAKLVQKNKKAASKKQTAAKKALMAKKTLASPAAKKAMILAKLKAKTPHSDTPQGIRLGMAADRLDKRTASGKQTAPTMGTHDTIFGKVTLSDHGMGKGGFATTSKANFGKTDDGQTDGSYAQILEQMEPETIDAVIAESKFQSSSAKAKNKYYSGKDRANIQAGKKIADLGQRRLAAHLTGIGMSEHQRYSGAPKSFRAGLRQAKAAKKKSDRVGQFYNAFPQGIPVKQKKDYAFDVGARAFLPPHDHRITSKRRAAARHQAAGYLSDDSDDDG